MINFCDWRLKTKITCDKVSVDGYSPENLISKNFTERARGYLSESFVKPPINLTVHLPCNIEVYRIIMDPQVGAQKSTGIDMYTASKRLNNSWLRCGCNKESCNICDFTVNTSDVSHLIFVSVAKLSMNPPGKVCFENPRYSDSEDIPEWLFSSEYQFRSELRHRDKCSLSNVSHITIRITRTGVNNAALRNLEIWGRLASTCSRTVRQTVCSLFVDREPSIQNDKKKDLQSDLSGVPGQSMASTSQRIPTISVPDDFLDPITCEIMALPVVLPCGKNIDQLTLDKHIDREASWGRQPNDPFTGVTFTNKTKPFPNAALKSRIDAFLLQYGDRYKDAPRTVGSKSVVEKTSNEKVKSDSLLKRTVHLDTSNINQVDSAPASRKLKRFLGSSECGNVLYDPCCKKPKIDSTSEQSLNANNQISHESELSSSLNAAVDSTLGSLTSFTQVNKDPKGDSPVEENQCIICLLNCCDKSVSKYQLPCQHIICRSCLLSNLTQIHCHKCTRDFSSKDVRKFNS